MMKNYIIKLITEESKKLIKESGIRDISKIAKRYPKAKIYFHMDLDGVTTALAMKNYLEQHGIKVVDAELIQYGAKEFAVKKPEGEGDVMPVLVDFAHGKPMFVIHTDHHDTQAGVEQGTATNFKPSRSNVETISQTISPKDIFSPEDIQTISMIDSADFAKYNITTDDVINYIFNFNKDKSLRENKRLMGLVANKLLLAFKNKPNFLSDIVMNAQPSLLSILNYILSEIKSKGYASIETMKQNQEKYIESRKEANDLSYEDGVISQYGLGSMKAGSYDRYTPFKNFPDAEFLVTGLPLGIVQASCNPYKKERALKGVDLGKIKNEVLNNFKDELSSQILTFGDLKRISEQEAEYKSVGFTFKDMLAIYGNRPSFKMEGGQRTKEMLDSISSRLYRTLSPKQKEMLNKASVDGFDVIEANSGGHKCITNITGINFIYRNTKDNKLDELDSEVLPIATYSGNNNFVNDIKGKLLKFGSLSPRQIEVALNQIKKENGGELNTEPQPKRTFIDLIKDIQNEFVRVLKEKIDEDKKSTTNENYVVIKKKSLKSESFNLLPEKKTRIVEQSISLPLIVKGNYSAKGQKNPADALHSFERRKSDGFGGKMSTIIKQKLLELYNAGINPDVTSINIKVDSKKLTVDWEATLDESKDGKAYMGVSTVGSAGANADARAKGQIQKLMGWVKGAKDYTLVLDFVNPRGVYIHQYFYKYTLPEKYPPHDGGSKNYTRTEEPVIAKVGDSTNTDSEDSGNITNIRDIFKNVKNKLMGQLMTKGSTEDDSVDQTTPSDETETTVVSTGGDSNFMNITKKVINNFEGGYWNPFCHSKRGMGKSTETMFGLDRYNGNIESSPEGKQFFKIIDDEKYAAGAKSSGSGKDMKWTNMGNFCNEWKWNYRGGDKEQQLKELAASIMKKSFDRNISNFVKDQKTKDKIMNNKGLLMHMAYATWNGPGFFKKFAQKLQQGVQQGMSDKQLIDLAIQSRNETGLLNKSKVEKGIRNPDSLS